MPVIHEPWLLPYLKQTALVAASLFVNNHKGREGIEEYNYSSKEDYLLDQGKFVTSDEELTEEQFSYLKEIADRTKMPFEPKQCYHNAMMLAAFEGEETEEVDGRLVYMEGYSSSLSGYPVPHAWIIMDGTKIVDLTRSLREEAVEEFLNGDPPQADLRDRVLGKVPEGWVYFGCSYQKQCVIRYIFELNQTGSLIDDWNRQYPLWKEERLGNFPPPDVEAYEKIMKSIPNPE